MSTCNLIADILWTLLRQITRASQTGYNDAEGCGQEISSYELQLRDLPSKRLLGEGLAGIGYETEWKGKKCVRKEFVGVPSGIFREEAANLIHLEDHKNIVKTYGWTVDKRSCSLILEFMDDDLVGFLQKRKEFKRKLATCSGTHYVQSHSQPFELLEALNVIKEIAEGLKQLHDKGIEHGDLKTRNILVNYASSEDIYSLTSVKVADFGLFHTKRKSIFFVSRHARKLDMVRWKAPEILRKRIPPRKLEDNDETSSESDSNLEENISAGSGADTRSLRGIDVFAADAYSFALTCSQILTGEEPYPRSNWKRLAENILDSDLRPQLLDGWPRLLKELLQSCWDKDPSKRPTFLGILQSLQVILQEFEPRSASGSSSADVGNSNSKRTSKIISCTEDSKQPNTGTFSEDDKTIVEKPLQSIVAQGSASRFKRKEATSASSSQNLRQYDVFLNHRGPDLKKTFVSHLDAALRRVGRDAFLDADALVEGMAFDSINEALAGALVHVAIFSPGYAESKYCLDELCDMLASQKPLIPVFYNVDPVNLQNEKGPFAKAFSHHMERGRYEDVTKWKGALKQVTYINGIKFTGNDSERRLVDEVVAAVLRVLPAPHSIPPAPHPVDLKKTSMDVVKMLHNMGNNVGVLGIWGVGGIGTTTLAREVYNQEQERFGNKCFLGDVKDAKGFGAIRDLQMKMVGDLLGEDARKIGGDYARWFETIQKKKVLLVVDDVSNMKQFVELIPDLKLLAPGSRVLITSRESDILNRIMASVPHPQRAFYSVQELSFSDSLELFIRHAFQKKRLSDVDLTFRDKVMNITKACGGVPLALEVMGGFLANKENELRCWTEAIYALREEGDIKTKLQISYDSLISDDEKCMFLDIACLMHGHSEEIALEAWNSICYDLPSCSLLDRLIDKFLVKVNDEGQLDMHHVLRDMGRRIVMELLLKLPSSFRQLRNLTRLALEETSLEVLPEDFGQLGSLKEVEFDGCRSLLQLPESFGNLSNLEVLRMGQCVLLQKLPVSFCQLRNLTRLALEETSLEELPEDFGQLGSLKEVEFNGCRRLLQLPESFGNLSNLEVLRMGQCVLLQKLPVSFCQLRNLTRLALVETSLEELPEDFGQLGSLKEVEFNGCRGLLQLPESFGNLSNLEVLRMGRCELLQRLPSSFCKLTKLSRLVLGETGLRELPDNFGELGSLKEVEFNGCRGLLQLPESFGNLSNLEVLRMGQCVLLQKLPASFCQLRNLTRLALEETSLEELPEDFGQLGSLKEVEFDGCKRLLQLPESFGNLSNLEVLRMGRCELLQRLPSSFCKLTKLSRLVLGKTGLRELPDNFGELGSLKEVEFNGCRGLLQLPESFGNLSNLEVLRMGQCVLLQKLPASFWQLRKLTMLVLKETGLRELPEDFSRLSSLKEADFDGCWSLMELPESFGNLSNLEVLRMGGCELLQRLPSSFFKLKKLTRLALEETGLEELPGDFGLLSSLKEAYFDGCRGLVELPESFGNLSNLEVLGMERCELLQKLPSSFRKLIRLSWLALEETGLRELPEDFGLLRSLKEVNFDGCRSLAELPESFGNLRNLEVLRMRQCKLLQRLPCTFSKLTKLSQLVMEETGLRELPGDIGLLSSLKEVNFDGCRGLVELPESFGHLSNLEELRMGGCELIQRLPRTFSKLRKLTRLALVETALIGLPEDFGELGSLKEAYLDGCRGLVELPESFGNLSNLEVLRMGRCELLQKFPSSFCRLTKLSRLALEETGLEELPESFANSRACR